MDKEREKQEQQGVDSECLQYTDEQGRQQCSTIKEKREEERDKRQLTVFVTVSRSVCTMICMVA